MKVLVVDAFFTSWSTNTGARMKSNFSIFQEMVCRALSKIPTMSGAEMYQTSPPELEVCAADDLESRLLVCDWEKVAIEESHRRAMARFDAFDIILVAGDSDTSPFDSRLTSVAVLCKMAYYSGKPFFICGAPAGTAIFSICCKGRSFDILGTGKASRMQSLPQCGDRAAFVDEIGDLYQYDSKKSGWTARMNTGLHLQGTNSKSASKKLKATETFARSVEQRVRKTALEVDYVIVPDRDCLTTIKSMFSEHFLVKGLQHGNSSFLSTLLKDWAVNRTISVPRIGVRDIPLAAIAEGPSFPVLLSLGPMVVYVAEVNSGKTKSTLSRLVENFVLHNTNLLVHSSEGYISRSILRYVFEEHPVKDDGPPCAPISNGLIKSVVDVTEMSVYSQEIDLEKSMSHDPYQWGHSKTFYPPSPQMKSENDLSVEQNQRANQRSEGRVLSTIRKEPSSVDNSHLRLLRVMDVCRLDSMSQISMDESFLDNNTHPEVPTKPSAPIPTNTRHRNHVKIAVPEDDEDGDEDKFVQKDSSLGDRTMSTSPIVVPKIEGLEKLVADNRRVLEENAWLPHQSPRVSTDRPVQSRVQSSVATATVSMTSRASSKKSNYKRLVAANESRVSREAQQPYKGLYTDKYVSEYEKQSADRNKKDKWVAKQGFRTTFGFKGSQIPLRPPAQLGPSEYKENPEAIGLKFRDIITLRVTDKSKWVTNKPWVSVKK